MQAGEGHPGPCLAPHGHGLSLSGNSHAPACHAWEGVAALRLWGRHGPQAAPQDGRQSVSKPHVAHVWEQIPRWNGHSAGDTQLEMGCMHGRNQQQLDQESGLLSPWRKRQLPQVQANGKVQATRLSQGAEGTEGQELAVLGSDRQSHLSMMNLSKD